MSAVEIEDVGRVRVLTIDRPEALNAMNQAVFEGLREGLKDAASDDGIAVCVVTGRGEAFSAGQDLTEMEQVASGEIKTKFPSMLVVLKDFEKPLIAAVNGIGVGIGMTMLGHCDLVLMADSARLRTPFPQLGLAPEAASSVTFPDRMGWQNAAYVLMSGRWFDAEECHEMGLAWRVVPRDRLMDETMVVAEELAANPIESLVATKKLLLASGQSERTRDAHDREMKAYGDLLGGPANVAAVRAFLERKPC